MPTTFDRIGNATPRLSWKIYTANSSGTSPDKGTGYIWSMCPYFADCLYTSQANNMVPTSKLIYDVQKGTFPQRLLCDPGGPRLSAQRLLDATGENWINSLITPLMGALIPRRTPPSWA